MNSLLNPKVLRVNVFRSMSCSQSIRQRIRRRAVTLYFNLHRKSQILVFKISGLIRLDLLSPLRRTPLLPRPRLSSSEVWIQISQCGYQSEPPVPSYFFSRLGRQRNRCPRVFLSTKSYCTLGFPHQISRCTVSMGQSRLHEARSFFGRVLGRIEKSHARGSVSCCIFSIQIRTPSSI